VSTARPNLYLVATVFHPDCAQLNEAHTSRSSPKNFLMKFSTLGNMAVRLATIQQPQEQDK